MFGIPTPVPRGAHRNLLRLGVVPVFMPPRETGFQAMIESYNGWWQAKVWSRFQHAGLEDLQGHPQKYVAALLKQRAARIETAPDRRARSPPDPESPGALRRPADRPPDRRAEGLTLLLVEDG